MLSVLGLTHIGCRIVYIDCSSRLTTSSSDTKMNPQPTTTHSCYSACSAPSASSSASSSSSSSPSSALSIVSSFLPPSSRDALYGAEFDPFYGGDPAINTIAPTEPSPYQRPVGSLRAFDLSRSLCDGFGLVKDQLLDVFGPGFDSITATLTSTTSTASNSVTSHLNGPRHQLMRNQPFEEDAQLQQLGSNECRQRDISRMTQGYGGRQSDPESSSGQAISAIQMWSTNWSSTSTPYSSSIASEYIHPMSYSLSIVPCRPIVFSRTLIAREARVQSFFWAMIKIYRILLTKLQ